MKKLLIGAFIVLAMTGCSQKGNFLKAQNTDRSGRAQLVETNLCLYDNDEDKAFRILSDGNSYYIITTRADNGEDVLYKFKSLNKEVLDSSNCVIIKDDIIALPIHVSQPMAQSNVVNNNIYVNQDQSKPVVSEKELQIQKLKAELNALENN